MRRNIQWSEFFQDSNSQTYLIEFMEGRLSLDDLERSVYFAGAKRQVQKMRELADYIGIGYVEELAAKALRRRGFGVNHYTRVGRDRAQSFFVTC